jgi:hypothetical protein
VKRRERERETKRETRPVGFFSSLLLQFVAWKVSEGCQFLLYFA